MKNLLVNRTWAVLLIALFVLGCADAPNEKAEPVAISKEERMRRWENKVIEKNMSLKMIETKNAQNRMIVDTLDYLMSQTDIIYIKGILNDAMTVQITALNTRVKDYDALTASKATFVKKLEREYEKIEDHSTDTIQ